MILSSVILNRFPTQPPKMYPGTKVSVGGMALSPWYTGSAKVLVPYKKVTVWIFGFADALSLPFGIGAILTMMMFDGFK